MKAYLIDVYEKHEDEFSFEDELFLKEYSQEKIPTIKELAGKQNMSLRTYYRKRRKEYGQ